MTVKKVEYKLEIAARMLQVSFDLFREWERTLGAIISTLGAIYTGIPRGRVV